VGVSKASRLGEEVLGDIAFKKLLRSMRFISFLTKLRGAWSETKCPSFLLSLSSLVKIRAIISDSYCINGPELEIRAK
jgi:hypothetical protein